MKTTNNNRTTYETKDGPVPPLPPGSSLNRQGKRRRGRQGNKKKKGTIERLITGAIWVVSLSMILSLYIYFRPFLREHVFPAVKTFCSAAADTVTDAITEFIDARRQQEDMPIQAASRESETEQPTESEEQLSYMDRSQELGNIADMSAEPVFPTQEDAIYTCMLDTALGPLVYYNQGDIRWKEYLYGGSDRLAKYGCGPVCVAMLINSFTSTAVSPVEMADWSAANGYYARQSGSYHGLIPGSLSAFGLQVESVTDRTADHVRELLKNNHVLVALMGRGALTQNGHFIIIAQLSPSGNVYIADPASYENSTKEWDLQQLMDELKKSYDSGGPLWAVSLGETSAQG